MYVPDLAAETLLSNSGFQTWEINGSTLEASQMHLCLGHLNSLPSVLI